MKHLFLSILAVLVMTGCNAEKKQEMNNELASKPDVEIAAEGKEAPNFTLKNPEGKPITLKDLRGQYVVLDFWGSWCKWCIKGIPDMKAYYQKYQGKFEILSIDFGDTEEKWLKAIKDNDINWLNVITDEKSAKELQTLYALQGFPTKVIINPDGVIVKIVIGEDPVFYEFLDNLFQ